MQRFIDKLSMDEFYDEFEGYQTELDDDNEEKCDIELEIYYKPVINKKSETVAVIEVYKTYCSGCGETGEFVNQIFTNGNEDLEMMVEELGYRNEENDYE